MYWCCVCLFRSSSRWNFILQRHIFIPLSLSLLLPIFYDFLQGIRIDPGPRLHKSLATKISHTSVLAPNYYGIAHISQVAQNWTSSTKTEHPRPFLELFLSHVPLEMPHSFSTGHHLLTCLSASLLHSTIPG